MIYNASPAAVQSADNKAMNHDYRDFTLRALILVSGGIAAVLLAMKGYGTAIPAVAVGGALGAFFASRAQTTSEE